jgi:hypothetical protein
MMLILHNTIHIRGTYVYAFLLSNHVLGLSKLTVKNKREIMCRNAPTCMYGSRRQ